MRYHIYIRNFIHLCGVFVLLSCVLRQDYEIVQSKKKEMREILTFPDLSKRLCIYVHDVYTNNNNAVVK